MASDFKYLIPFRHGGLKDMASQNQIQYTLDQHVNCVQCACLGKLDSAPSFQPKALTRTSVQLNF